MQNKNKRTKKTIKVQDLKPSKDAKGGVAVDTHGVQSHGVKSHGVKRPGNSNT